MDYSYLNQGFDTACSLSSMDPSGLSSCQLACSYPDLSGQCSQISPQYPRYPTAAAPMQMRPTPVSSSGAMITGSRMTRGHNDHHHQVGGTPSVFPTSMGLQSKWVLAIA